MGNLLDKIASDRPQTCLAAVVISALAYLQWQHRKIAQFIKDNAPSSAVNSDVISQESFCKLTEDRGQHPIYRVAISGGPCGGKTSSLSSIKSHFQKLGFNILSVPEVPTLACNGGVSMMVDGMDAATLIQFQASLMRLKIYLEDFITKTAALSKKPCIVLCDRGMSDFEAYMTIELVHAVRQETGWTQTTTRDRRYDSVVFMVSTAVGAEEFYTTENNAARHEGVEDARALDRRTLNTWVGHPQMTICQNVKGQPFQTKVDRAIRAVQKAIGLRCKETTALVFLVDQPEFPAELKVVKSIVQERILKPETPYYLLDKIQKRGQDDSFTYMRKLTANRCIGAEYREETRRQINSLQFEILSKEMDPRYNLISKLERNFCFNDVYFTLDTLNIKGRQMHLLSFEQNPAEVIPEFIHVLEQVTDDPRYFMCNLARKDEF